MNEENGSHVFVSSLSASNTKHANLTWLPLGDLDGIVWIALRVSHTKTEFNNCFIIHWTKKMEVMFLFLHWAQAQGSKCNFVIFGSPHKLKHIQEISIQVKGTIIDRTESFLYLGVTLHQSMSWADHIDSVCKKINQRIGLIRRVRNLLPFQARVTLYNTLILPLFDYGGRVKVSKETVVLRRWG